jgi:raffinose/stachyose/melibiose transport system permease protein
MPQINERFGIGKILIYLFAIFWLIVTLYPLLFLFQNSLKGSIEFFMGAVWNVPENPSFVNYIKVWNANFIRFLGNSIFIVGLSLIIVLLLGSSAAFGLSRIRFRLSGPFYYLFVGGLTIPVHITLIPVYVVTREIGLYDTIWALLGPFVAFTLPIAVFVLASFMAEIPLSLEEAAYMDGASRFRVYSQIIVPISRPAMTGVGIYISVILWNEFIFPLVLISSVSIRPLTLALWNFQGQFTAQVPTMMAALLMSMIPLLVVYAIFKERLIEGLVAGAIKE